ncbi:hypothetical protein AJ79_09907 [Helicocarpus griseus UAMH5409]|uniref:Uncharacterized protein n=1 Tax=Helicocarpus griseus UAMH5409 TaxID=1447875 RepID=A0A2B7WGP1_9EURO|nr:hypothetical protein AJ79_09907 [Helicocarpus griseus UAMH5409]
MSISENAEIIKEITDDLIHLQLSSCIHEAMNIHQFLNSVDEAVENSIESIDEQVLAQFDPEIEAESDEKIEKLSRISSDKTLDVIKLLCLYKEQQNDDSREFIQSLDKQEHTVNLRRLQNQKQRDI